MDIFVSYTSEDREKAFWIGRELEALGHRPLIHDREIPPGGDIVEWMERTIESSDRVLCVISRAYLAAPYSSWERKTASWASVSGRENFVIPILIEDCQPPLLIAYIKRCNLFGLNEEQARARLAEFLREPDCLRRGVLPAQQSTTEIIEQKSRDPTVFPLITIKDSPPTVAHGHEDTADNKIRMYISFNYYSVETSG